MLFFRNRAGLLKSGIVDDREFAWFQNCLSLGGSTKPGKLRVFVGRPSPSFVRKNCTRA
jgi:hypothetical protein